MSADVLRIARGSGADRPQRRMPAKEQGPLLSADFAPKTRFSPRSFHRNFASAESKPMKIQGECTCNSLLTTQKALYNVGIAVTSETPFLCRHFL
jgi:hypothetical protein